MRPVTHLGAILFEGPLRPGPTTHRMKPLKEMKDKVFFKAEEGLGTI